LTARWEQFWCDTQRRHPVRPTSYETLLGSHFQYFPELFDAARTRLPLEVRHPFLDLRLMRYLLAVPVIPWCRSKYLIRRAMRGTVPDEVLRRPKTGVPCAVDVRRMAAG